MPTPDQFRAARTLLGLTQYRCREMMGIGKSAIEDLEDICQNHRPQRPYAQYYNLWLREYARMVKPELLGAVDSILGNESFARMFRVVEPVIRKKHVTVINELDLSFPSVAACARWLIEHKYTSASADNVAQRIRNAVNGTASPTYLGFTYHYDNPPQNETTLDI